MAKKQYETESIFIKEEAYGHHSHTLLLLINLISL